MLRPKRPKFFDNRPDPVILDIVDAWSDSADGRLRVAASKVDVSIVYRFLLSRVDEPEAVALPLTEHHEPSGMTARKNDDGEHFCRGCRITTPLVHPGYEAALNVLLAYLCCLYRHTGNCVVSLVRQPTWAALEQLKTEKPALAPRYFYLPSEVRERHLPMVTLSDGRIAML